MIRIKSTDFKKLQNGELSIEQVADNLLAKYPVKDVAIALVEALSINDTPSTQPAKITVSEDDFKRITDLFRIAGTSNRGRKRKDA